MPAEVALGNYFFRGITTVAADLAIVTHVKK
jgi:hypothetical protein